MLWTFSAAYNKLQKQNKIEAGGGGSLSVGCYQRMSGLWCQVAVAYFLFVVIFAPIIEVGNSKSSRKFSQCPVVRSSTGSSRSRSHKRPQHHQHQHYCERSQLISHVYKNISTILRFTLSFTEHITVNVAVLRTTS